MLHSTKDTCVGITLASGYISREAVLGQARATVLLLLVCRHTIYTLNVYEISRMKEKAQASSGRTNIVLDMKLVNRVKRLAKVKTTREAVHIALDHYIRSRDYSAVLALRGSGGVAEGYDPKTASPSR